MKKINIEEYTANLDDNRSLDVALLVLLGVKKIHFQDWDDKREYPYYIPSGKPWRTHRIDARPVLCFTTDWHAMGILLAALVERRIYLIRLTNGSMTDKTPYACWLGPSADNAPWTAIADDAPRAVAEAAYHALAGRVW